MKPELIIHSDLLDILFENRNKEYGAYELRRHYQRRLLLAISCTILVVASAVLLAKLFPEKSVKVVSWLIPQDSVALPIVKPAEKLPPPEAPAPPTKTAAIDNATIVITSDDVADSIPTIDQLLNSDARIDVSTIEGPPDQGSSPSSTGNDQGNEAAPQPEVKEVEEKILERAEFMPQYPGGVEALRRFLGKNLRVPEDEVQPGERVRMDVRFVVDSTGVISGIEFPAHRSVPLEKEVKRVIGKMPRWTPGLQNGRKVNVYFTIPVIFEVPEY